MDFAQASVVKRGGSYNVSHGDDRGLIVHFEKRAIEDTEESNKQGRPIFRDRDFVIINIAGDQTRVIERPVDLDGNGRVPPDNVRFPRQWAAFQAQNEQTQDGTPITEWPPISKSQAAELKAMHIHTVEALAAVADSNLKWMGARDMQKKAQAWLSQASDGAGVSKLVAENASLRNELEAIKAQIAGFSAQRRPGRPAKESVNVEDNS
jgi:hypothetical protein